jgi:type IX secretion system PorP/SprF family membrane protein
MKFFRTIMKKLAIQLTILSLGILSLEKTQAQTDPSYRQYRFNALTLNPAQAGSNEYSDVSVVGTQYWVGMPGAPKTATVSGNFRVFDNFGAGATFISDQTGPVQSTSLNLVGAYHLKINNNWKISAGLKLSAINHSVITSELSTTVANDPDMMNNLTTGLSYNAGFGFLAYSKKVYVGFSVPRVASLRFNRMDMSNFIDKKGGYITYAGVNLELGQHLELRPSVMAVFGYGGPLSMDINAVFTAKKLIDFGLTYHLKGSIGAIVGVNIKDRFYVGYSYAYPMITMNKVSIQSHELALRLKFNKAVRSADSPRFFN